MRLELGINNCFAVKRWPRAVDWMPIVREALGLRLVQHSLDLVDLTGTRALLDSQADTLRRAAGEHEVEIQSTFTGLAAYSANLLLHSEVAEREHARAWFGRAIAFTGMLGAEATGGHVGAFSVADWRSSSSRADLWMDLQASLDGLSGEAHEAGLSYLVVENLAAAREPSTMAMIRELLGAGDASHVPIRLCLDVGHMCTPGTSGADRDPYAWLRRLGGNAAMVQLQQSDAEGDHHWPFTGERNAIGRIDADRVIDALTESGADEVLLLLEIIPPFEQDDEQVIEDLLESVDYWRDALARRGVAAG
jgi:hypothetical protein